MLQKQRRNAGLIDSVTGSLNSQSTGLLFQIRNLETIKPGALEKLTAHDFSELTSTVFVEIQMRINKFIAHCLLNTI